MYQPPSNPRSDRQSSGGIGGGPGFDVLDQPRMLQGGNFGI
jgi:hypothetical protein